MTKIVAYNVFLFLFLMGQNCLAEEFIQSERENSLKARILLSATNKTILSSQIAGSIKSLSVREGESFSKGQTLISIDCDIQKAQREKALAELMTAKAKFKVQKQLEKLNSGSTLDIRLAEANIKMARADLSIIDISLKMCHIKAPFSGQVVERKVDPHQYVSIGQSILEIVDNRHLEVKLIVPSSWLIWLKPKVKFTIYLDDNNKSYSATIKRIGAQIDSASQSINVIGKIDQKTPELISGMSGNAIFRLNKKQ